MARGLIFALAVLVAACGGAPDPAPGGRVRARIAEDVTLTLPSPPAYPGTRMMTQVVRASYGGRSAAFEAVLSIGPDETVIVLTVLGGPRLATVTWNGDGVREERTLLAPEGVPVENIVADMFMTVWPEDAVRAALPDGVHLVVGEHGGRTVRRGDDIIMEITPDAADPSRVSVRNLAFDYQVEIVSQTLQ